MYFYLPNKLTVDLAGIEPASRLFISQRLRCVSRMPYVIGLCFRSNRVYDTSTTSVLGEERRASSLYPPVYIASFPPATRGNDTPLGYRHEWPIESQIGDGPVERANDRIVCIYVCPL